MLKNCKELVTTQEAMMDGEERTTKYAEGAKKEGKLMVKDASNGQRVRSVLSFRLQPEYLSNLALSCIQRIS